VSDLLKKLLGFLLLPIAFFIIAFVLFVVSERVTINIWPAVTLLLIILPIVLPIFLYRITFDRWQEFTHGRFRYNNPRVTLRVRLPNEVFKSPEAMESVFTQMFAANGSDNLWQAYIDGKHPLPASFELVSIGGDVRFYINVHQKIKDLVESQLYSQYPGIEIEQEPVDYAAELRWLPSERDLMSFHIVKKNDQIFPIKTYVDFGHDRMPKEEEKFEPMAALIEHLGRAKPHERLIVQIICTPHAKREFNNGNRTPSGTWDEAGREYVDKMLGRDEKKQGALEETENRPILTSGERDTITAIERNLGKVAYETGIRAMYYTMDKMQFDGNMIGPMLNAFRQFDILNRNGVGVRWRTEFDNVWLEDFSGAKQSNRKKEELEQLKRRSYYPGSGQQSIVHMPKVMSAEELATLWHIPGRSVLTPGLGRIPSTRSTAPGNLPIADLPQ
jgi:hypothetical protein